MNKTVRELALLTIAIVELLLMLRFVLKLFAARPQAEFVAWIYEVTQPLLRPFLFAFPTPSVRGGFTLEFTTLFALFVYAFVGYLIREFFEIVGKDRKRSRS